MDPNAWWPAPDANAHNLAATRKAFFLGMEEAARMVERQDLAGTGATDAHRCGFAECIRARAVALSSMPPAPPRSEAPPETPEPQFPGVVPGSWLETALRLNRAEIASWPEWLKRGLPAAAGRGARPVLKVCPYHGTDRDHPECVCCTPGPAGRETPGGCSDCGHPRDDHAISGKPGACAWRVCSCKAFAAAREAPVTCAHGVPICMECAADDYGAGDPDPDPEPRPSPAPRPARRVDREEAVSRKIAPVLSELLREPVKGVPMLAAYHGRAAVRELRALLAVARALKRVQWHGADIQGRDACILCNGAETDGHFPRCPLARLDRASGRKP